MRRRGIRTPFVGARFQGRILLRAHLIPVNGGSNGRLQKGIRQGAGTGRRTYATADFLGTGVHVGRCLHGDTQGHARITGTLPSSR